MAMDRSQINKKILSKKLILSCIILTKNKIIFITIISIFFLSLEFSHNNSNSLISSRIDVIPNIVWAGRAPYTTVDEPRAKPVALDGVQKCSSPVHVDRVRVVGVAGVAVFETRPIS